MTEVYWSESQEANSSNWWILRLLNIVAVKLHVENLPFDSIPGFDKAYHMEQNTSS